MMQARWGSHGHYEIIALAPISSGAFYQTIRAFNLSEKYRTPVLVMTDEVIGHMSERVVIPDARKIGLHPETNPEDERTASDFFHPLKTAQRRCRRPEMVTGFM